MRTIGFVMCDYLHGGTERVTDMISAALLRRGVCKIVLLAFRFTDQTRARATAIGYDVVELGNGDECEYHGEETTRIVADAVRSILLSWQSSLCHVCRCCAALFHRECV